MAFSEGQIYSPFQLYISWICHFHQQCDRTTSTKPNGRNSRRFFPYKVSGFQQQPSRGRHLKVSAKRSLNCGVVRINISCDSMELVNEVTELAIKALLTVNIQTSTSVMSSRSKSLLSSFKSSIFVFDLSDQ